MQPNYITRNEAISELWRRGLLSFKNHPVQKEMYDIFYNSKPNTTLVWLLARQSGKCLKQGTQVMTPEGPIAIENLKIGQKVYGYNLDGTVSLTDVVCNEYQGEKEVVDLINHNKIYATSSLEHRWQVFDSAINKYKEVETKELKERKNLKIVRKFIQNPLGEISEEHAYAIGALLGDGCSKQNTNGNQIFISSEDSIIPKEISKILNCNVNKNGGSNYTWCLTNATRPYEHTIKPFCNYYSEWIHNRYAHEKIVDLNIIKKWDRKSLLKFVAGLIDTDGHVKRVGNEILIQLGMQSKSVIDAAKYAFMALWQADPSILIDDREKYKNGPVYVLNLRNLLFNKTILKELDQYLLTNRKKWKIEYESLIPHNSNENYVGVKLGEPYLAHCYDIQVNNETNLYLLANGLVTHNSYLLAILALEQALRTPNSVIKLVTDTKVHIRSIFEKIFDELLIDCPLDLKPEYVKSQYTYVFTNGSLIQLAGSDNKHYEKLRGQKASLILVDEAGFCNDLETSVKSVLIPTTIHTGGKIVLASTPPEESEHDFLKFIEEAELNKTLTKKTIDDNPLLTKEQRDRMIEKLGGINSPRVRREFYCDLIRDASVTVIPEFTQELEKEIVKDWPVPPFFDCYESMDLGGKDLTVVLFAYYDFRADKIIVQDELVVDFRLPNNTLPKLVSGITEKETALWTNVLTNELKVPYIRVSDINHIVTQEIYRASGNRLNFTVAKKDDKDSALNNVRVLLANKKIIIDPKCQTLIRHLRNVKWSSDKNKREFGRSADHGHYDAVDALVYLVRHTQFQKNPYPAHYNLNTRDLHIQNPTKFFQTDPQEIYKTIFGITPKKRRF